LFSLIGFLLSVSFVLILYFIKNDLKAEDWYEYPNIWSRVCRIPTCTHA
jgi:hypothetical protein